MTKDILAYLETGRAASVPTPASGPFSESRRQGGGTLSGATPPVSMDGGRDRGDGPDAEMIADHMVRSVQTSPHVTSFVEADVTRIVDWRNRNKRNSRPKRVRTTFTPFFIEAVAKSLREFPGVNAGVDGDRIILKKGIHIGMAAATRRATSSCRLFVMRIGSI